MMKELIRRFLRYLLASGYLGDKVWEFGTENLTADRLVNMHYMASRKYALSKKKPTIVWALGRKEYRHIMQLQDGSGLFLISDDAKLLGESVILEDLAMVGHSVAVGIIVEPLNEVDREES